LPGAIAGALMIIAETAGERDRRRRAAVEPVAGQGLLFEQGLNAVDAGPIHSAETLKIEHRRYRYLTRIPVREELARFRRDSNGPEGPEAEYRVQSLVFRPEMDL
jgi:hypothetical protein